ncbi:potassium-transporting ATPase subunit KdpC [Cellulomonas humilata]|uniref:Potassium-transporting ATPase KdpC subunit n=1 Tax=Cellulomonas humilata TaxID=144055 RepID=A0ABU0E9L2_9CELL|nr:potassium-transporting ATPase subunit KdpC [Cellulomonas humilata]MDQ0371770.1 K+-transporting ATPase ATPase C chain [Cellulomonas humilata]
MTITRQHYSSGSDTVAFARQTWAGLRVLLVLTVLLGFVYPLAVTGIAQVAFPWQANGSLVSSTGERVTSRDDAVGSLLIGQGFDGPEWFHPRPSAAGDGYDTLASAGSNLGPLNEDLLATVVERRTAVADAEGVEPQDVPVDALTASGSGLDPDISPEYAELQVARVARERGLSQDEVRALVEDATVGRDLGVLGEPRVNVLRLNLALQTMGT